MSPVTEPDPIDASSDTIGRELLGLRLVVMSATHQLNNILSGLLGYADLERELADGEASPLIQTVIEQCERGLPLSRALMNLAARAYGRTETVSPVALLEDMIVVVSKYLTNSNISVSKKWPETPTCTLDVGAVRQAFLEILLYGAALLPNGGEISIEGDSDEAAVHIRFQISVCEGAIEIPDAIPGWCDLGTAERTVTEHGGQFESDESEPAAHRVSLSFPLPPE